MEDDAFDAYNYMLMYPRQQGKSTMMKQALGRLEMKVGDYVVWLRQGKLSELGRNKKNIWKVKSINPNRNSAKLENISDGSSTFDTDIDNLVKVSTLINSGRFKKEYFNTECYNKVKGAVASKSGAQEYTKEYEAKFVGETKMRKGDMVKRTLDTNTDAVKMATKVATGRTVNAVVATQLRERKVLPALVRGYADTALGTVVIANLVDFAVKQFAADNAKFNFVSDAMMQAAMVDLMAEFDFEALMNDVLSNVSLGDITE